MLTFDAVTFGWLIGYLCRYKCKVMQMKLGHKSINPQNAFADFVIKNTTRCEWTIQKSTLVDCIPTQVSVSSTSEFYVEYSTYPRLIICFPVQGGYIFLPIIAAKLSQKMFLVTLLSTNVDIPIKKIAVKKEYFHLLIVDGASALPLPNRSVLASPLLK